MDANLTVKQWVDRFEAAGLDAAGRDRWHRLFEREDPEGHARFLAFLGLDAARIEEIRRQSA